MGLGGGVVQFQRVADQCLGLADRFPRAEVAVARQQQVGIGQRGAGRREMGVGLQGLGEQADRRLQLLRRAPPPVQAALAVLLEGHQAVGAAGPPRRQPVEGLDQRVRDLAGDLVLDREHVVHLTVEILRPDVEAVIHADQLRGQADAISVGAHASFQHRAHVQQLADLAHVPLLVSERERRGPRGHLQALHLRQQVQDLLRDAVRQVGLVAPGGQVCEWQHRDRVLGCRGRRGPRVRRRRPGHGGHRRVERIGVVVVEAVAEHDGQQQGGGEQHRGLAPAQLPGAGRAPDTLRGHVEQPRQHEHHRKTEDQRDHDQRRQPIGQAQRLDDAVQQLQQHEHADRVRAHGPQHLAA